MALFLSVLSHKVAFGARRLGAGGRRSSKQQGGYRGEAGRAHRTLLVKGIWDQCQSGDTPSASPSVVVGYPGGT